MINRIILYIALGLAVFLLALCAGTNDGPACEAATRTLDRVAEGGIHDHVGGGFHRYVTDTAWRSPRFEKTAPDQAELLESYLHAYQLTGKAIYGAIRRGELGATRRGGASGPYMISEESARRWLAPATSDHTNRPSASRLSGKPGVMSSALASIDGGRKPA